VRSCHDRIVAHARRRLEAPMHLFPRGLGSASEAHCPARLGSGGLFCRNRVVTGVIVGFSDAMREEGGMILIRKAESPRYRVGHQVFFGAVV